MKSANADLKKLLSIALVVMAVIWLTGCSKDNVVENNDIVSSDQAALESIADSDEDLASFMPNYNEDNAMNFALGKTSTEVYPVKVGQKMTLLSRTLDLEIDGDTAYGKLTKTFTGFLVIAASYDPVVPGDTSAVDTVIEKPFSTTITRNIIFVKKAKTKRPIDNWKIAAISLPEGGTLTDGIEITKLTMYLPNGDTLLITSPNDYYLYKGIPAKKQIPSFTRGENTVIRLEVRSAYADTDFVTVTYGADKRGMNRMKRKFELKESVPDNGQYLKVYELTTKAHQGLGHFHAVVNVIPKPSIFDDAAPVEESTWGVPYIVK